MKKRHLVTILILFALGMISQANTFVLAQESAWTTPLELDNGWFPDIAVGHEGSVHIVWNKVMKQPIEEIDDQGDRDALLYRMLRDGEWTQTKDIFIADPNPNPNEGSSGYTVRNSIAAGPDGRIHALFRKVTDLYHFSAPLDQSWSASAWGGQTQVNGGAYYNALAIDSTGRIHALWTQSVQDDPEDEDVSCANCANLFYRFSDDGGTIWSWSVNLSSAFEGANRPQIKIDQFDRIHVVWDEGFDWYVGEGESKTGVYIRSDDRGETWGTPKIFGLADDYIRQTTLGLTTEGDPLVVYRSNQRRLYYQLSQDGGTTWANPAEIPGVRARVTEGDNNLDAYSIATDSAGDLHLLMGGFREDEGSEEEANVPSLLHLRWNGEIWSAPETVMSDERFPEWPRIAVANGNQLHAVWFTRPDLSEVPGTRVQYSSKLIDAPTQAAAPIFTPTPVTTPTATPVPPSPTPFPTLAPSAVQAPPLDGGPAWEGPALVTIFIALTPFLGFLIVVGVVTLRTRLRNQSRWQ